jgi:hypothetical protein
MKSPSKGVATMSVRGGVVLLLLLAGCNTVPLNPRLSPPPGVEKLPLTVGVHYTSEFRAYARAEWTWGGWSFALGEASVRLFDQALPMLFDQVQEVEAPPPAAMDEIDAILVPRVNRFSLLLPGLRTRRYRAQITYGIDLYGENGQQIASWEVSGYGSRNDQLQLQFGVARGPGVATDRALCDAARSLLLGLPVVPAVKAWLRARPSFQEWLGERLKEGGPRAPSATERYVPRKWARPARRTS